MSTSRLAIVAFALLAAACSAKAASPPEIVVDRTLCSHCGMFVSEPVYAAAYQVDGKDARVFDDIGCMLDALRRETASPVGVWLQDTAGSGWLTAVQATFVRAPRVQTPMRGGVLAYANAAAAEKAAAAHDGVVVRTFDDLKVMNGGSK